MHDKNYTRPLISWDKYDTIIRESVHFNEFRILIKICIEDDKLHGQQFFSSVSE